MTDKEKREKIVELYKKGIAISEIRETVEVTTSTIYNALMIAGVDFRHKTGVDESNLVYADNRNHILENIIIDGKTYTDVTPLFAPR